MDNNIYDTAEGEVILQISKLCDEFEKNWKQYLPGDNGTYFNRAFNIFMQRKWKELKLYKHLCIIQMYCWLTYPTHKTILNLHVKIVFKDQPHVCLIEPEYYYEN